MRTLTLKLLIAGVLTPLLTAATCGDTKVDMPDVVRVSVPVREPAPSWATDPLPKPEPVDGSVGARAQSEHDRGLIIDLANCHRRLLKRIDAGETVDRKECER